MNKVIYFIIGVAYLPILGIEYCINLGDTVVSNYKLAKKWNSLDK